MTDTTGIQAAAAAFRHASLAFAGPTWPRLEGGEYLVIPPHGWTCFHCGMTFTDFWAARGHFGTGHMKVKPQCIRTAERMSQKPTTRPLTDEQWMYWQKLVSDEHDRQTAKNDRLRGLLQDVIDDMTFNVAPSKGTMAKIKEAMQ